MKPILYSPTDTDFEAGGIGVLVDCKKCLVTEEGNGAYTAELAFPINAKYSEQLEDHNYQIKCKPNAEDDYHIFISIIITKIWLQAFYMFMQNLEQ